MVEIYDTLLARACGVEFDLGGVGQTANLSKMDLVKHHLVGVSDTPESRYESQCRDDCQAQLVVPFRADGRFQLLRLDEVVELDITG